MPLVRKLVDRIWEVRSTLPSRREARLPFTANENRIVVLSGFIKKTQKTPQAEVELARMRLKGTGVMKFNKKHVGSSLENFLEEEGILEAATTKAMKRVVAWQLAEEMKAKRMTKKRLAELMHTSRAQVDRILDPDKGNITIESLQRAAALLGRRVRLELL